MFREIFNKDRLYNFINFEDFLTPKLLAAILLSAVVLRFQGIFWGIPVFDPMVHNYHPDEPKIIQGACNFPHHILSNSDLRYPTFYHYFIGSLSIPARLIFKINGWAFEDFKIFVSVFGRLITIFLGVGAVFLTFILAKKLYDEKVGLLSALFVSLSLYHVQNSSWATLDVPNSFFFILTVYIAFRMHEKPTTKAYLLTGISLGILIGTKYIGAISLILILILHFHRCTRRGKKLSNLLKTSFSKNLWILFLTAGIVFLLTTPAIFLKPIIFTDSLSQLVNRDAGRNYRIVLDYMIFARVVKNYATVTDPVLTVLMILGLVYPLKKRWDREIPILIVIVIFFFAFGALTSRHLIAVLPLTSILGAQAIWLLYKKVQFISKTIWIYFLAFWILFALAYNIGGILLRKNDTRTETAYYIEENIPAGSTLGATSIGNYSRWEWMLPKIDPSRFKVVDALQKPEYIILTSYDYKRMEEALISDKLHYYKWDPKFSAEWYRFHPPAEEVFRFYDEILNNKVMEYKYRLIKKFEKNIFVPIEFPPPQIRIYENLEK
jgi:hypothetical protein